MCRRSIIIHPHLFKDKQTGLNTYLLTSEIQLIFTIGKQILTRFNAATERRFRRVFDARHVGLFPL